MKPLELSSLELPQSESNMHKEGAFLMSPTARRHGKNGIFGNYVSKGKDQVRPPDICFSYAASTLIIVPSGFCLAYS